MNNGNWGIRIWRILAPLLLYFAALNAVSAILPRADVSAQVMVSALICLPLLIFWYIKDHQSAKHRAGAEAELLMKAVFSEAKVPGRETRTHAGNAAAAGNAGRGGIFLWRWAAYGFLCLLTGAALSALSAVLMRRFGIYARFSNETQLSYQASPAIWMLLGPGLFGPVCEELVYRGLVYQRLCREIPAVAAAAVSSLIFAAGHGNMIQFLYALPMGLLFCAVSEVRMPEQRNVFLPIMLHLGANLYSVLFTLIRV